MYQINILRPFCWLVGGRVGREELFFVFVFETRPRHRNFIP